MFTITHPKTLFIIIALLEIFLDKKKKTVTLVNTDELLLYKIAKAGLIKNDSGLGRVIFLQAICRTINWLFILIHGLPLEAICRRINWSFILIQPLVASVFQLILLEKWETNRVTLDQSCSVRGSDHKCTNLISIPAAASFLPAKMPP